MRARPPAPVRPRISSRTSGFFFCGMMLLPVQRASGRLQERELLGRPEDPLLGPAREVLGDHRQDERRFEGEIAVARRVQAVGRHAVEAEGLGHVLAVDRQGRAGQGRRAQRQDVEPLPAIGQSVAVAGELLDEGQEVMRGQDRLGPLQVGVAGQDQAGMAVGRADEGFLQGHEPGVDPVDRVAGPELDVGRHLVVAAPGGVELPADVAQAVDQGRLDVHVDVLALEDERESFRPRSRPGFRTGPRTICWHSSGSEQTDVREHLRVRDRAPDVVLEEPTVKGDRFAELFDATVGLLAETARPKACWPPGCSHRKVPSMRSSAARRGNYKAVELSRQRAVNRRVDRKLAIASPFSREFGMDAFWKRVDGK